MGNARRLWPAYYAIGTAILNATSERILLLCSRELERMTRFGLRRSKSRVQYFFVDGESFEGGPNGGDRFALWTVDSRLVDANLTKVVYLAQFGRHKNHMPLLRAWVRVVERFPKMLLVLAGSGELLQKVKEFASELGIEQSVCFPGRLPREAIPGLLHLCSYAVVTSRTETFGSCIVEPLLAMLPVCATPVGVARELEDIDGIHPIRSTRPSALAKELLSFFSDPELEKERMLRGKAWVVQHCAIDRVVDNLREIWANLLHQGAAEYCDTGQLSPRGR
jgi:glycosyltransferase involved in cell wall biosynthesis